MGTKSIVTIPRIRLFIYSVITLGITSVLLWGLVSIDDPQATLTKFNLSKPASSGNDSLLYFELELTNPNYFRGFNYTGEGGIEIFRVTNGSSRWGLGWVYIPAEYQDFRSPMRWNFTLNLTDYQLSWKDDHVDMREIKSHQSVIRLALSLTYAYKILLWATHTTYYTWLDTNIYLDQNLNFNGASPFHRIHNFTGILN